MSSSTYWIWGWYRQGSLWQHVLAFLALVLSGGSLLLSKRFWPRLWLLLWYQTCSIDEATIILAVQGQLKGGKHPGSQPLRFFICQIFTLSFKPPGSPEAPKASSQQSAGLKSFLGIFRSAGAKHGRLQPMSDGSTFYSNPLHSHASSDAQQDALDAHRSPAEEEKDGPEQADEPDIHVVLIEGLRYQLDKAQMELLPAEDMPVELQQHVCRSVKALAGGYAPHPMSATQRNKMAHIYGDNFIAVPSTHWAVLLCLAFLHPLYLFQLYAVGDWIYYEYIEYSVMVFIFTLAAVIVNVVIQHRQSARLKQAASNHSTVSVLRFPGDYVPVDTDPLQAATDDGMQGGWREVCAPLTRMPTGHGLSRLPSRHIDVDLNRMSTKAAIKSATSQRHPMDHGFAYDEEDEEDDDQVPAGTVNLMSAIKQTMSWVEHISAEELVVGDLVLIDQAEIPADMILLQGEVVVDESVITGENVPMNRTALQPACIGALDYVEVPATSRLLSGTQVIVASGAQSKPCIAVVTHTGFASIKGRLVHTMIHANTGMPSMTRQATLLILVLLAIGLGFYGWNVEIFKQLDLGNDEIGLRAGDIITVAVPPALIVCLMIMTTTMLLRLKKRDVAVEDARRIPLAGVVNVVCLDKTGTITDPNYQFARIVPMVDGLPGHVVTHGRHAALEFKVLMATCHGLVIIGDTVKGHPLDLALYRASGWKLQQEGMDVMGPDGTQSRPSMMAKDTAVDIDDVNIAAEMADSVTNLMSVAGERWHSTEFGRPGSGYGSADFTRPNSGTSREGSNPWLLGAGQDRPFANPSITSSPLRPARRMFTDPGCPPPEDHAAAATTAAAAHRPAALPRRVMFQLVTLTPRTESKEDMHHKPDFSESSAISARLNWNDNFMETGHETYATAHGSQDSDEDGDIDEYRSAASSQPHHLPPGRKSINLFAEAHMQFVAREHMFDVRSDTTRRMRMAGTMSMNGAMPSHQGGTRHGPLSSASAAPPRSTMSLAGHASQHGSCCTSPSKPAPCLPEPSAPRLLVPEDQQRPSFMVGAPADHAAVDPLLGLLSSKVRNVLTPMAAPMSSLHFSHSGRHSSSPGVMEPKAKNWTLSRLIATARMSLTGQPENSQRPSSSRLTPTTPRANNIRTSLPLLPSVAGPVEVVGARRNMGMNASLSDGPSRQISEADHPSEFFKQLRRFRNSTRRQRLPSNIMVGSAQGMMLSDSGRPRGRSYFQMADEPGELVFEPTPAPAVMPATEELKASLLDSLRGSMLRESKAKVSLKESFTSNDCSPTPSHIAAASTLGPTMDASVPSRHSRMTARSTQDKPRTNMPLFQTPSGRMSNTRPSQTEAAKGFRALQLVPDIAKSGRTSRASRPSRASFLAADRSTCTSRASPASATEHAPRTSQDSTAKKSISQNGSAVASIVGSLVNSIRDSNRPTNRRDSSMSSVARTGSMFKFASKLTFSRINSYQVSSAASTRTTAFSKLNKRKLAPRAPEIVTFKTTNMWAHPAQGVPDTFKFKIVHRYPFSSADQRCTVVVEQPGGDLVVYIKGAPEKLAEICDAKTLPPDYAAMVHNACQPGCMVLGAAIKHMPSARAEHIVLFDRMALEAGAEFIGLITLSNTLRQGALEVVQEIMHVGLQAVMVTGDSLRSGTQVALQLGMLPAEIPVIAIECKLSLDSDSRHGKGLLPQQDPYYTSAPGLWEAAARAADNAFGASNTWIDSRLEFKLISSAHMKTNQNLDAQTAFRMLTRRKAGLVITGAAFSVLLTAPTQSALLRLVLRQAVVYARMLPPLKKELVALLSHAPSKPLSLSSITSCLKSSCTPKCTRRRSREAAAAAAALTMHRNRHSHYGGAVAEAVESGQAFGLPAHQEAGSHGSADAVYHGDISMYQGLNVAFCGDGANDLAALKAAAVGISVSGAAGTLAASISISPAQGLEGLRVVLSEGRTTAINMITAFQFIMVYAFAQLLNVAMLYSIGLEPTQYQYLMQDLFYTTITAVGMGLTKPSEHLTPEGATLQLISVRVLLPVAAQFLTCTAALFGVKYMLASEEWFQALGGPLDLPPKDSSTEEVSEGSVDAATSTSPMEPPAMMNATDLLNATWPAPPLSPGNSAVLGYPSSPDVITAPPGPEAPSSELDYDYVPLLDEDYSLTRPEPGIITIVALTTMLGAGLAFSLYNRSARQRAMRNYILMIIWIGQAAFVLYLAAAPGNAFKRYGPRGPSVADFPASFRFKLSLFVVGTVVCQFVVQLLVTGFMSSRLWCRGSRA